MAMQDWIHRYPQVERLLQRGPDEDLCYGANRCEIPRLAFRAPWVLDDDEYRSGLRELRAEITQQQDALDRLVLAELESFRQALDSAQGMVRASREEPRVAHDLRLALEGLSGHWGRLGFEDGTPVLPASTIPEEPA
jgi:hypothetical protein